MLNQDRKYHRFIGNSNEVIPMVYMKADGKGGFSWEKHFTYLFTDHPQQLEEIAHARFEMLTEQNPQEAAHYRNLDEALREKIDAAACQNKDFGCVESALLTKEFVRENHLMDLFEEVPGLSSEIDDTDFSFPEDDPAIEFIDDDFDVWITQIYEEELPC